METIQIAELKANLSKCLKRVRAGERFVVLDRNEPVAELGPRPAAPESARDRLIADGRIRPPTGSWPDGLSETAQPIDAQAALEAVRMDAR